MTVHRCACGKPARDTAICSDCGRRLTRWLTEAPALLAELELTLCRQTAMGRQEGGQSATKPLPFNLSASTAIDDLQRAIRYAAIPGADAAEVYKVVKRAVEHAREVIDRPQPRWYAGPCQERRTPEDAPCKGELYADVGAAYVACPDCGANHDVTARRSWLRESVRDHLGTGVEISALCRHMLGEMVTVSMIRGYAFRGTLEKRGEALDHLGKKAPIYRLGDVFDVAAKAAADPHSRRLARRAAREAADA